MKKKSPLKKPKPYQAVSFETALAAIRRGRVVRRATWHPASVIGRLGNSIYVVLPMFLTDAPKRWEPYPNDILATDWRVL